MLVELRIAGVGVIERAELELGPGLTVLTGETGAGKTMVLTAVNLLLGGRADAGVVRTGSERAEVEGLLRLDAGAPARARADELGAVVEDDELLVARTVSAQGRSRAVLGGRSVPVSVLAELAEDLVAVHGQSAQVALLRPDRQRDLLDAFGAPETVAARSEVATLHARLAALRAQCAQLRASTEERAAEVAELREGLAAVDAVAPETGEDDALMTEQARLGHAEGLRDAAGRAATLLAGDESSLEQTDVLSQLAAARAALEAVRHVDPVAAALADRLAESSYLLVDLAGDVSSYLADVEADPQRLAAVSERRAQLAALMRRFGPTLDDVLAWAQQARTRLDEVDGTELRLPDLEAEADDVHARLAAAAARLGDAREKAASRLAQGVTAELAALAMPHARFDVVLSRRDDPRGVPVHGRRVACAAHGTETVAFVLAPHAGATPRPLDRGASGGELSRTMLALEVVLAAADPVPTLVFDEVDAGVGGRAAVDVGRRLARLARTSQVLVVTHLPQVAAFADRHYVVRKGSAGQVTVSDVRLVTDTDRGAELARMMAGIETSDVALQHAAELLAMADER
jgi:DNA repair protein RecN (Recombination protein N)